MFIKLDFLFFVFHRLEEKGSLLGAHLAFLLRRLLGLGCLRLVLGFILARSFDLAG